MPHRRRTLATLVTSLLVLLAPAGTLRAAPTLKGRAVWAHPRDAGTTEASVVAFVDQLARAHVNTVVMEVKAAGGIFWPSTRFADAVVPDYRAFDFPAVLIREAHTRGIAVHAWFFDFAEGADSYVVRQHPEWLARNPAGEPTTSEVLRGQPYRLAWMCPASPRLHRPVAGPAHRRVRDALRRRRDSPRLRPLPRRPGARHLLLLR